MVCGPAPASAQTASLLPDLRTRPHEVIEIGGGELHLSNTIINVGVGPLEVFPEQTEGDDCDGDGDVANDRQAFQNVYTDSIDPASPGYFVRDQDLVFTPQLVGCMIFHPEHDHWHFEDFSYYALRSETSGLAVGRSVKVSYCILDGDLERPALPGAPADDYYGDVGCTPTAVEGLSIGWADTYGAYVAGQDIPVAGLPAGNYCLISRSDPVDRLEESNERNNARRTRLLLDPAAGTVERLAGPCEFGD
jgi:hypothetical protein